MYVNENDKNNIKKSKQKRNSEKHKNYNYILYFLILLSSITKCAGDFFYFNIIIDKFHMYEYFSQVIS